MSDIRKVEVRAEGPELTESTAILRLSVIDAETGVEMTDAGVETAFKDLTAVGYCIKRRYGPEGDARWKPEYPHFGNVTEIDATHVTVREMGGTAIVRVPREDFHVVYELD